MPRIGDRGAGTILMLAVVATLTVATLVVLVAAQLVLARARAASAADLAALAGARSATGVASCAAADDVARANSAALLACRSDGADVVVEVQVQAGPLVGRLAGLAGRAAPRVYGTSRAGPASEPFP